MSRTSVITSPLVASQSDLLSTLRVTVWMGVRKGGKRYGGGLLCKKLAV